MTSSASIPQIAGQAPALRPTPLIMPPSLHMQLPQRSMAPQAATTAHPRGRHGRPLRRWHSTAEIVEEMPQVASPDQLSPHPRQPPCRTIQPPIHPLRSLDRRLEPPKSMLQLSLLPRHQMECLQLQHLQQRLRPVVKQPQTSLQSPKPCVAPANRRR